MRVDIGRPPVPGGTTKKGNGVNNFAFIILEVGGVCLENELKLALENLEFILVSLVPFRVGDFGSLKGPGSYLVYLKTGSKDIAVNGHHLRHYSGNGVISLNRGEFQRLFYYSSNNSLAISYG